MHPSRRKFIHDSSLLAAAGLAATHSAVAQAESPLPTALTGQHPSFETPPTKRRGDMVYRELGSTGEEVSLVGLGGSHIGQQKDPEESIRIIRTAIDRGITFLDNCWDYHDGESEHRMGRALEDGYRQKVFLMTKIDGRTKDAAAKQIDESLERLKTDHLDLMQFHEIIQLDAPDRIFSEGGAWEAMDAARKAGKVRYIGFTGHKDPMVHLRMLDEAKQHKVHFDTVQMPVNVMDAHFRSFTQQVLPRLIEEKIGPLAMKPFGSPYIVKEVIRSGVATPTELHHYVMSLPVSVMITGIDSLKILDQAIESARTYKALDAAARAELVNRVADAARDGKFEKYKTTAHFDGTAQHPQWLESA
ncbi:MAG TPA: aldo/keto reductase [Lacipirellulaceae bacterium]|jgi:predicted aldo/keto reductase-like oxidoreductase|nr:aldo/keto reductase [Lacipirellulaceae bacterium]